MILLLIIWMAHFLFNDSYNILFFELAYELDLCKELDLGPRAAQRCPETCLHVFRFPLGIQFAEFNLCVNFIRRHGVFMIVIICHESSIIY